jgi:hypothetical protein
MLSLPIRHIQLLPKRIIDCFMSVLPDWHSVIAGQFHLPSLPLRILRWNRRFVCTSIQPSRSRCGIFVTLALLF